MVSAVVSGPRTVGVQVALARRTPDGRPCKCEYCERPMLPRFLTGDLVEVQPVTAMSFRPAMVISVQQSNNVPDAHVRGLDNVYGWSYWVMFTDGKIQGPLMPTQVSSVRR